MSTPEPRLLSYASARARVLGSVTPLPAELQPLMLANGRALRRSLDAPHTLPPFRNSAMDGFAVRSSDLAAASAASPLTLAVLTSLPAGTPASGALPPSGSVRIMTGAEVPAGADAIVPFEDCERSPVGQLPERATFVRPVAPGENVREAGADIATGQRLFENGHELSPHDLAVLAALGWSELLVSPIPRVAVLSTGDELLGLGEPLRPGAIRDSNLPMLSLLVAAAGAEVVVAERLPDQPGRVAARLVEVLAIADVVLTIGGVSAGDHDPVKQAISSVGDIELWRVAMRPGRPQAFGLPHGRLFFGLPGNPASVACVFEALVRPALRQLAGHTRLDRPRVPVRMREPVASRAGRHDFVRCEFHWQEAALWASPAGAQISGHLAPQSRAHGLVIVPENQERLGAGETAEALVWRLPEGSGEARATAVR